MIYFVATHFNPLVGNDLFCRNGFQSFDHKKNIQLVLFSIGSSFRWSYACFQLAPALAGVIKVGLCWL
ncbi:hypothetical protein BXU11_06345 [Flavobacterium sp. LM5]|nr:hypothetical protein BXU11_06345 [Flavobacterium sp. LM5]